MPKATLSRQIETVAHPLTGAPADYNPLLALAGTARFVLLGEASHRTHEFYRARAQRRYRERRGSGEFQAFPHLDVAECRRP
jgi:erythromycin esterase-like protein